VPEVLRKYIPGQPEFLPFTKELPKDSTSQKQKGNAPGPKTKITTEEGAVNEMQGLKV